MRDAQVISTGGSLFCTGSLVNNSAGDGKLYFLTANHCGIGSGNAASLVTYWNFPEKRVIGQLHGGPSSCTTSDKSDYYGRLSVSWSGGGTASTRLSNWLDPGNPGL